MGASQNWMLAMQYRSRHGDFLAAMVDAKNVKCGNICSPPWRVVFSNKQFREEHNILTLLTDLTGDPRREEQISCHCDNESGKLNSFQLIYNTAMIVAALSNIFHGQQGTKQVAFV